MERIGTFVEFAITNSGGTKTIVLNTPPTPNVDKYIISGSPTLSSGLTITYSGTPVKFQKVYLEFNGSIILNGQTVTILGRGMSQSECAALNKIEGTWDGSTWVVKVLTNNDKNKYTGSKLNTMTAGGGTVTFVAGTDKKYQIVTGTPTLSGNWVYQGTGVNDGDEFFVKYIGVPVTGGTHTVTIFGYTLTDSEATGGNLEVHAVYDLANTAWRANVSRDVRDIYCVADVCDATNEFIIPVLVSFESTEAQELWIPLLNQSGISTSHKIKIRQIDYMVQKTVSGTDNGTISVKISGLGLGFPGGTNIDGSPITIPMSSISGYVNSITPASNNTSATSSQYLYITSSKTTAGGRIYLFIRCVKVA